MTKSRPTSQKKKPSNSSNKKRYTNAELVNRIKELEKQLEDMSSLEEQMHSLANRLDTFERKAETLDYELTDAIKVLLEHGILEVNYVLDGRSGRSDTPIDTYDFTDKGKMLFEFLIDPEARQAFETWAIMLLEEAGILDEDEEME